MFKKQHVASVLDVPDFVRFLRDAVYEEEDCERVHATCDRMEEFLSKAGPEIRDMVAIEMFEGLQTAQSSSDSDSLARFLGPETKRLWAELQAIWKTSVKLDLQDRTVLEGEVLMSRILRQVSLEQSDLFRLHSREVGLVISAAPLIRGSGRQQLPEWSRGTSVSLPKQLPF